MAGDLKAQIEISADASGVEVGVKGAKRSLADLGAAAASAGKSGSEGFGKIGAASKAASNQIDAYIKTLQTVAATNGKSARETELYGLSLRGASTAQLQAADSALKLTEAYERGGVIGERFKTGLKAIALASIAAAAAGAVAVSKFAQQAGSYKGLAEQIGDSASAVSSLQVAADTSGKSLDSVASFSVKLTKALSKTSDESKSAGKGLAAIGLNFDDFKKKSPVEQLEAIAKALKGFEDGAGKTAALEAIAKGGAQLLPFLNDLGDQQERQILLTDAQIIRADEYSKAQARMASNLKALGETIVVESLPSISDLTAALTDAIKQVTGLGGSANDLKGNTSIASFADNAARGLASVIDVANKVRLAFVYVGETIGATAAIIASIGRGELAGAGEIIRAARERGQEMLKTVSVAEALDKRIAERQSGAGAGRGSADDPRRTDAKKQIDVSLLNTDKVPKAKKPKVDKSQEQAAKAQLALDIESIKAAAKAEETVYANAESIMQAKRAAGLIDDRKYYAEKLGLLQLNGAAQEAELNKEIARLNREQQAQKFTGKDKLDNDKKIAEAESKLAILRANYTAKVAVLGIEEEAAAKKIALAYLSARQAAQDYFETIQRQQARELSGIGQGAKTRDFNAGISQIEDRYADQRRDLENLKAQAQLEGKFTDEARIQYEQRLSIIKEFQSRSIDSYAAYYDELTKKQGDWSLGANEALQNYLDDSRNVFKQTENLVGNAFKGMEDALVSFATTGKLNFSSLANSIIADIIRMQVKAAIASSANGGFFGTLLGAFGIGGADGAGGMALQERAAGGPVGANGVYLVGERGPEILRMGAQGGHITPNNAIGAAVAGSSTTINVAAGPTRNEVLTAIQMATQASEARVMGRLRDARVL